jgi:hypothetical protein
MRMPIARLRSNPSVEGHVAAIAAASSTGYVDVTSLVVADAPDSGPPPEDEIAELGDVVNAYMAQAHVFPPVSGAPPGSRPRPESAPSFRPKYNL